MGDEDLVGRELDLRGKLSLGDGDVLPEGELIAAEVMDVPAGTLLSDSLRVGGGDAEPVFGRPRRQ